MSFAWLHKKISLRTSIIAICGAVAVTLIYLQICLSLSVSENDGDTPEICRLYLEQNAFVHDHFGRLQGARFVKDKSVAMIQEPNTGTVGLYTFCVSGTKAAGTLEMLWAREVGSGALTVNAISITDERPFSRPVTDHSAKKARPLFSGLPEGPLAMLL